MDVGKNGCLANCFSVTVRQGVRCFKYRIRFETHGQIEPRGFIINGNWEILLPRWRRSEQTHG